MPHQIKSSRVPSRLPPPRYLNLLIVLQPAAHFALPVSRVIHTRWRYLGVMIALAGLALNMSTVKQLKNRATLDFSVIPRYLETRGASGIPNSVTCIES